MNNKTDKLLIAGVPITTLIGIIACFGDDAVGASINPALASISAAFPDIPYSQVLWLYSMPKLVIIPMILIAGLFIGRKVSYRVAAIVGFSLIAIGGMLPFFLNDFWLILGARFICGIGLGIQSPIGPALVLKYFPDPQKRATVLGIGHGFINIYGVLTNLLVGFLCVVDWHLAFLSYGTILILLLIAVFFLNEPNDDSSLSASEIIDSHVTEEKCAVGIHSKPKKSLREMPISVIVLCLVYMGTMCIWGVAGLNLSVVIESKGFGDAATAGAVISLINISGMLAGFAFGGLSKIFGRYVLPFGCFLMAAGFIIYYLSPNVYVLSIGMFVAGLANTVIITSFEAEVGSRCSVSLIAMGMSLCMIASQFSGFITPFYINFVMDVLGFSSYSAPLAISAACLIVIGVCFALVFAKQKNKETQK